MNLFLYTMECILMYEGRPPVVAAATHKYHCSASFYATDVCRNAFKYGMNSARNRVRATGKNMYADVDGAREAEEEEIRNQIFYVSPSVFLLLELYTLWMEYQSYGEWPSEKKNDEIKIIENKAEKECARERSNQAVFRAIFVWVWRQWFKVKHASETRNIGFHGY